MTITTRPVFEAYAYAYPHKTAYRPLEPARALDEVWSREDKSSLFLYLHVPFCEMRCGFCNLFTDARPRQSLVDRWLDTLARSVHVHRAALGRDARFVRMAVGGGTPSLLSERELTRLFELARVLAPSAVPTSLELSPETVRKEKVRVLVDAGVTRASLGVQSFLDEEAHAIGRPQVRARVDAALDLLRGANFPTLNIDLVYGIPGQTPATWEESLRAALRFSPEELYLYPLYVRPLTGLGRLRARSPEDARWQAQTWDAQRLELLQRARGLLEDAGYSQASLRMFRKTGSELEGGLPYRCQDDGMVGLGPGARSYTRHLHYSSEYAVGLRGVREILERWVERTDAELGTVDHGFELDDGERRRRWIIQSLLQAEGLSLADYLARFGGSPLDHLPELSTLVDEGLALEDHATQRFVLTRAGLERSDAIGPWLYSPAVRARMEAYALR